MPGAGDQRRAPGAVALPVARLTALLAAVIVMMILLAGSASASTTLDIRGSYVGTSQASGSNFSIGGVIDTEDCAAGTFSGHGVSNGQTYSNFTGTISGDINSNQITTHEVYTSVSYTADGVSSDSLDSQGRLRNQGTFSDSNGQHGTADSTRVSGPPNDGGCSGQTTTTTTSTSSSSTSTKRRSATYVQCDYDTFTQSFSCTAQVADASGTQPAHTPTGTVTFAIDSGADGNFPLGSSCTLQTSTSGPTAFCSVTYLPGQQGVAAGTQPRLSGTYSGDPTFASSSGRPTNQYAPIDLGPPDTTTTTTATSTTTTSSTTTTPANPHPKSCHVSPARAARDFRAAQRARPSLRSAGGHAPRGARSISRRQADRRAVALLRPSRAPLANGVALYGLPQPLRTGSVITEARLGFPQALLPALRVRERAWLYWEDLAHLQRYMHPSVVLLVAAKGGRVLARAKFVTYPEVNGHAPGFITSRRPRALYYRRPGRRHPVHLTRAELKRLLAAEAVRPPKRRNRHVIVGRIADVSSSTLITVVHHGANALSSAFSSDEKVMTQVFASHGISTQRVPSYAVSGPAALAEQVDSAAAAGRTTVTIFLDGHGGSAQNFAEPEVSLGTGTTPIRASDLTAITAAHPDIKFNFIIDACYAGRFVNPLSLEPNVASVATSSGATEESYGPVTITATRTATTFIEQNGVGTQPSFVGPLQESLYLNKNLDPNAPSDFTGAYASALDAAFASAGAHPDVTAVVEEAKRLEPGADTAALYGETNPSPAPFSDGTCEGFGTEDPTPPDDWFTGA